MNPYDTLSGHGFDTDTHTIQYFTHDSLDEETFFDKLMRFFVSQESELL